MVADILKDAEQINLKNMERGKYFRIAADIYVDGESLADMLIEAGMAVRYDSGKKTHKWCDDGCYVDTYPVKIENDEIILSLPS